MAPSAPSDFKNISGGQLTEVGAVCLSNLQTFGPRRPWYLRGHATFEPGIVH